MIDNNVYKNVSDYQKVDNKYIRGRKQKIWLKNENNESFLFKYGGSNTEPLAEVLASELGRQCGLTIVNYELARYKNELGVISKNFQKEGETLYSGDKINKYIVDIMIENNLTKNNYGQHSIENITYGLNYITTPAKINQIKKELIKMWVFDGLLLESDRNSTNWSLIKSIGSNSYKLAPIYDCSTILRLNNDVTDFINHIKTENDIYNLIKDVKFSMCLTNDEPVEQFIPQFRILCTEDKEYAEYAMTCINKINPQVAIKNIEKKLSIVSGQQYSIPYPIAFWIEKAIKVRLADMQYIYNQEKVKTLKK